MHVTSKARQPHIARPAFKIDIALQAFDRLITAAAVATNRCVLWDGDFVVDRNIVEVHVVDADAVAVLAKGRIGLQLLHFGFVIAAKQ